MCYRHNISLCLFSLLILTQLPAFAQTKPITIIGYVFESVNGQAVPYANVGVKNTSLGTLADAGGRFELHLPPNLPPTDSLVVSCMGYGNTTAALPRKSTLTPIRIGLAPCDHLLQTITVTGKAARDLVMEAIEKIPQNYPQQPFVMDAFYRQYHLENGRYVRLIEAALDIYDKGYHKPFGMERFSIKQLRRSKVYEQNGEQHANHLVDLLGENMVKSPLGSILGKWTAKYYQWRLDSTFYYNNRRTDCINFSGGTQGSEFAESGSLWITQDEKAIVQLTLIRQRQHRAQLQFAPEKRYEWELMEDRLHLSFRRQADGRHYPDKMLQTYTHRLHRGAYNNIAYELTEFFELFVNGVVLEKIDSLLAAEPYKRACNLYHGKFAYQPDFWETYAPALNYPLSRQLVRDLEQHKPLEAQFREK